MGTNTNIQHARWMISSYLEKRPENLRREYREPHIKLVNYTTQFNNWRAEFHEIGGTNALMFVVNFNANKNEFFMTVTARIALVKSKLAAVSDGKDLMTSYVEVWTLSEDS